MKNQEMRGMEFPFPKLYMSSPLGSAKAGNEEEDKGEKFGVILSRSRSVSIPSSKIALRAEKHNWALENAVKRAFSMRRSSSLSSSSVSKIGYYKIFDHCDDPDTEMHHHVARKSRKKKGNLFQTCRRLIGF